MTAKLESPEHELLAIELLEEALEQPSDRREAFITNAAGFSEGVRERAASLLQYSQTGHGGIVTGQAGIDFDDDETLPEQIGAYRILRLIGRGGMGNVYLAERASDDFDHVAAIKVIKRRLVTDEIADRFRRERQILAGLNHPHIAQLFDGGELENGAPYIVMEYVPGQPLHYWLDEAQPDKQAALEVFGQICDAVSFAHQHLVVHRDLTPPNVLIDEDGRAKLIDFGIARPQGREEYGTSSTTGYTPGFAAPERQTEGTVNVLSDVYSLGKILGLMVKPFSDRELDAIVAKATASEPECRYASVSALLRDVRDLSAGNPIDAFSRSRTYRLRKFVARERRAVTAASAALFALVAGLGGTVWAYSQAEQARQEAERRFDDVRTLANTMMFDIYDEISSVPGSSSSEILLAETAQKYLDDLAASQGSADNELRLETARGFYRLAQIQGSPTSGAGKRTEEAKKNYRSAERILRELVDSSPGNAEYAHLLNRVYYDLGDLYLFNDHDTDAALLAIDNGLSAIERYGEQGALTKELRQAQTATKSLKSLAFARNRRNDDAISLSLDVREESLALARDYPDDAELQRSVAIGLNNLGRQHMDVEQFAAARDAFAAALTIVAALLAQEPNNELYQRDIAYTHWRRAHAYSRMEDGKRSLEDFEAAISHIRQLARSDPANQNNRSFAYVIEGESMLAHMHLKDFETAERVGQQYVQNTLAFTREFPNDNTVVRDTMVAYRNLAGLYEEWGRPRELCDTLGLLARHTVRMESAGILSERDKETAAEYDRKRQLCLSA